MQVGWGIRMSSLPSLGSASQALGVRGAGVDSEGTDAPETTASRYSCVICAKPPSPLVTLSMVGGGKVLEACVDLAGGFTW